VPVLTGLPFGHVPTKVCLPVGAKTELLVEGRDVFVAWGHVGHGDHGHDHPHHDHPHHSHDDPHGHDHDHHGHNH
jgi:muramoyltetrapeptide carboxypeptidase